MTNPTQIDSPLGRPVNWAERHPFAIAAIFALLFAIQITPQFKMSPDGVSYMSIARSLILHGRLLRLGSPHLRYAPAYPIFIAPAFFLGSQSFIAVQILQWLYALALMWGIYAWFNLYAGKSAIWIAALTMANAGYWDLFRTASSEIVFAPCLIWAGYFLAKSIVKPKFAVAAILLASLACATRQAGVMLVPGFCLALLFHCRAKKITLPRAAILAIAFTLFIGLVSYGLVAFERWGAKQKEAAGDTGYTQVFFQPDRSIPGQIAEGLRRQSGEIGRLLIPGMWKTHGHEHDFANINVWIYAAVCIPVLIGWWRFTRNTADPLALTLPFYIALCVVYPYDSGTRFTVPVLAVLVASVWYLLRNLLPQRVAISIILMLTGSHIIIADGFWVRDAIEVYRGYQQWPEIQQVASKIPTEAKVIALRGPIDDRWMFLMWFTDRPVAPEMTTDPVAPFVDWIVAPLTEPDSLGFQTIGQSGPYKLERR